MGLPYGSDLVNGPDGNKFRVPGGLTVEVIKFEDQCYGTFQQCAND